MSTINAIIVDDEINGRQFLRQLLEKFTPYVKVSGEAANAKEAIELIESANPDLVFLDIEMPGKTGIEMLRQLPEINFSVVFVTAFNRYAVEALRLGAIDYLLKPVNASELQQAVERVQNRGTLPAQHKAAVSDFVQHYGESFNKITIPALNGYEFINFSEIVFLQSERNYTKLKLKDGKTLMATRLLGDFEEVLKPHNFFRVHKSFIINLDHIRKYTKGEGGTLLMTDGSEIDVSRRSKEAFLKRIKV